jgi:Cu(I)/Ag(I) efflux system membrane fusion protein
MDLVPVMKKAETPEGKKEGIELVIDPDAARLARIRTSPVTRRMLVKNIVAPGELALDETRSMVISSRVSGWIERLHADYAGIEIDEGAPLAEIYSPELVTAQKEYLLAKGTPLEASAREKLVLLGITPQQLGELTRRTEPGTITPILSVISGTVLHRHVSEGDYIKKGQPLFHISDLSRLWAYADLFESDLKHIEIGQMASVTPEAFPDREILARVTFIEPELDRRTRSVRARLEVYNDDRTLKPGMLADVTFQIPLASEDARAAAHMGHDGHGEDPGRAGVLAVPRSAIIDTGTRKIAFVETGPGRYQLRMVRIGASAGDYYELLDGLEEGERVVERGAFLLDSQTQLTGMAEEIYGGALGKESEKAEEGPKHIH